MCMICGRVNCCPSFHSSEEQYVFRDAEEAYENYLEVRQRCAEEYAQQQEEQNEEE